jgi:hypothetical protein
MAECLLRSRYVPVSKNPAKRKRGAPAEKPWTAIESDEDESETEHVIHLQVMSDDEGS